MSYSTSSGFAWKFTPKIFLASKARASSAPSAAKASTSNAKSRSTGAPSAAPAPASVTTLPSTSNAQQARWHPISSLLPRAQPRNPARNISAILFIIRAEFRSQRRLLIRPQKQTHNCQRNKRHNQRPSIRLPVQRPQAEPADKKSHIHRIPHVTIKSDHHQLLRRSHRRWRSVPRPAKIPDAFDRHRESQRRRNHENQAPPRHATRVAMKTKPTRQQPEPQRQKSRAHAE